MNFAFPVNIPGIYYKSGNPCIKPRPSPPPPYPLFPQLSLLVDLRLKHLGLAHTTPEGFGNGGFTGNVSNVIRPYHPEEFENTTITASHFALLLFVFEETSSSFSKSSVFKVFSVHILKRKAGVFKFLRFEELFQKATFS